LPIRTASRFFQDDHCPLPIPSSWLHVLVSGPLVDNRSQSVINSPPRTLARKCASFDPSKKCLIKYNWSLEICKTYITANLMRLLTSVCAFQYKDLSVHISFRSNTALSRL
jgi:hypothetical protein